MYITNGTIDHSTPKRGINNKNIIQLSISVAHSTLGIQSGLLMYLPDNNVSVAIAIASCVFLRPYGVVINVDPLNVVPIKTILPFTADQS